MKILVTGASGFLANAVSRRARRDGHEVIGLSRGDGAGPATCVRADLARAPVTEIVASVRPDLVVHAAGAASVGASVADPAGDFDASVVTWERLLDSVRRSGVRPRVVFPSSAAVYGEPDEHPTPESAPVRPISPYGFHKAMCESLADEYRRCFGLDVLVVRLFSVLGPTQRRLLVWDAFSQLARGAAELVLDGTGGESRDYLGEDDVAAILLALASSGAAPPVVNVASGVEVTTGAVAESLRDRIAPGVPIRFRGTSRPGDPKRWRADVGVLRSVLRDAFAPRPFDAVLDDCLAVWAGGHGERGR